MRTPLLALLLLSSALAGLAQQAPKVISDQSEHGAKAAKGIVPPPPLPDAYLFPPELKLKLRDLQYKGDQLEILNKKLELQIERNREEQRELQEQMQSLVFDFATAKKIDLKLYGLDAVEMKMAKNHRTVK